MDKFNSVLNSKLNNMRFEKLETTLTKYSTTFKLGDDLDKSIENIVGLLDDSFTLLSHDSYGSSVFLAITAMEETAKIHLSMYMRYDSNIKRGKDPLFKHKVKHNLSISPVFNIGTWLPNVIGYERFNKILSLINDDKLMELRNKSIYWNSNNGKNIFPNDIIDKTFSQEILLFAIESFDDSLVGYSKYSLEVSKNTDFIFESIKNKYAD